MKQTTERKPYVTTSKGIRGYYAVLVHWNNEGGFWEPLQTGIGSYETRQGAEIEAKDWARSEGVKYEDS